MRNEGKRGGGAERGERDLAKSAEKRKGGSAEGARNSHKKAQKAENSSFLIPNS